MYDSSNYWKLGLFVVTCVGLGVATLFWLGAGTLRSTRPVFLVTYFDESVQGLSVGASVKFRGVSIGEVESIRVSGDTMHLEVLCRAFEHATQSIPWLATGDSQVVPRPVPELRAQLTSANLTGQKYVALDIVDPDRRTAPELPDAVRPPEVADLYIPSRPSTLKSFEDALNNALDLFDEVGPDVGSMVTNLEALLRGVEQAHLPDEARTSLARLRETLDTADRAVAAFHGRVEDVDTGRLAASTDRLLNRATDAVDSLRHVVDSLVDHDAPETKLSTRLDGLLDLASREIRAARLPETTSAIREGSGAVTRAATSVTVAADQIAMLTDDLELTLQTLRQTVDSVRGLIEVIEHDPSSILRGRTYGAPPPMSGKTSG